VSKNDGGGSSHRDSLVATAPVSPWTTAKLARSLIDKAQVVLID
jgi:hypothetical protein